MKKNYTKPSAFVENIEVSSNILENSFIEGNGGEGTPTVSERRGSFGNVWSE